MREREKERCVGRILIYRVETRHSELTFLRTEAAPRIKHGWSAWNPPTIRITLQENAVTRFDLFEKLPRDVTGVPERKEFEINSQVF